MGRKLIDITGLRHGKLVVIGRSNKKYKKSQDVLWDCLCDCGNITAKEKRELDGSRTKNPSCGKCYQDSYIIIDNIVKYFTTKNEEFLFNLEHLEKVKKYTWSINNEGYLIATKGLKLHRYILDLKDSKIKVDHIDGNKLNNLDINLRTCTDFQNSKNKKKRKGVYSSKYKGVYRRNKKWACKVVCNYKNVHYSTHDTEKEAALMYNKIVPLFHGEYAKLNNV